MKGERTMAAGKNNIPYKIYLSEDEMPKAWYNVRADMKVKPAPLLNPGTGKPMWDPDNHLIKFITECDFSDPSYHLPHFYELFALWADEEDREFWKTANI